MTLVSRIIAFALVTAGLGLAKAAGADPPPLADPFPRTDLIITPKDLTGVVTDFDLAKVLEREMCAHLFAGQFPADPILRTTIQGVVNTKWSMNGPVNRGTSAIEAGTYRGAQPPIVFVPDDLNGN